MLPPLLQMLLMTFQYHEETTEELVTSPLTDDVTDSR